MRMRIARPLFLNYIVSPYGLAILSTLFFLVGWLLPSSLYTDLIQEPDLMFLDAETLLFFLLCVAGFLLGLLVIDFVFPGPALLESRLRVTRLKGFSLLFPLILTTGLTCIRIEQMLQKSPNILILLLAQQGNTLRTEQLEQGTTGVLGWASFMQIAVLWWTYWMLSNSRPAGKRTFWQRRLVSWLVLAAGLVVQIGLSILKVSRADMMPVFGGFAILYVLGRIQRKELSIGGILRYFALFFVGVMVLFYLFGALRGTSDPTEGLATFVGYTLASYNRLTAVLRGTLHYPYAGHGVYLSNFLVSNNAINAVLPLRSTLGWPDYLELWNSEFQGPQLAGLRYELIWAGVFGYLFSDFGWTTPLILTAYGLIYGSFWRLMKMGSSVGVALYPWFAFTALCWFSSNMTFDVRFVFFLLAGLLLMAYEKVLSLRDFKRFTYALT